jgi:cellulose synthase/poly-beta-1,6-N-acetylglucosamine synthase-like glycosyltransferase
MSLGVTCVICCHNSAARLPETLRHLAAQKVPAGLEWDVIIVDNASTDHTAEAARAAWNGPEDVPFAILHEAKPGLTNARLCAFANAQHEIISFIDDDNWVGESWVQIVAEIFAQNPQVAISGGTNSAVAETPVPAWFEEHKRFYAVTHGAMEEGELQSTNRMLPGAGLSLRKAAVNELLAKGFSFTLAGRAGKAMSAGEDQELGLALQLAGWKVWYSPRLHLQHFMPAGRLTWAYLRRMLRGIGESSVLIDPYLFTFEQRLGRPINAHQRDWIWRALASAKDYAIHFLRSLPDGAEGNANVIYAERARGRVSMLLRLRGEYTKRFDEVARAAWLAKS